MNAANYRGTAKVVLDPDGNPYGTYEFTITSNNAAFTPISGTTTTIQNINGEDRYVFEVTGIVPTDVNVTPTAGIFATSRPTGTFAGGVSAPNTTHPTVSHDFRDPRPTVAEDPTSELY